MKHLKIAATADGGLVIEGYGVPFGGPIKGRDLHGQYFSKKTDFALDLIPDGQRPLLYQHGLDSSVDTAVIGRWGVKRIDDGGVWVRAQLDARSEYINEIKELVDNDALGFSSGTMGHLVKVAPKTGEILKWALVELSLTPNPANPNAYIVRANKSAAAHVKSLFSTKHGDHDQSEHGNWAHSGGGADNGGDKEKSKPGFYGSDHWDKPGMPKTVVVSEMSRDKYDRAILPMPDEYKTDTSMSAQASGSSAWAAVTMADSNGWLDENDDVTKVTSGLDIPYIPAENITSPESWLFALGFANGTLSLAPSEDDNGNVIEAMSRSRDKEDFIALSERLTDVNSHSSAATFDSLIDTWDEFGPGASKKMLRVKRSTKHGDHDQSDHGNWAHGDGGARESNRVEMERRSTGAWQEKFGTVGNYTPSSRVAGMAATVVSDAKNEADRRYAQERVDAALHMASQWNAKGPVTMPNGQVPLHGRSVEEELARRVEFSPSERDKEFHLNLLADLKGETPAAVQAEIDMDKFNDWMSGYDVPGMPKTFRVKRSVKHGDHDQSEHGNWAHDGGNDKTQSQGMFGDRLDELDLNVATAVESFLTYYTPARDSIARAILHSSNDRETGLLSQASNMLEEARTAAGLLRGDGPGKDYNESKREKLVRTVEDRLQAMRNNLDKVAERRSDFMYDAVLKEVTAAQDFLTNARIDAAIAAKKP